VITPPPDMLEDGRKKMDIYSPLLSSIFHLLLCATGDLQFYNLRCVPPLNLNVKIAIKKI
jgi:hypothetical protein